MEQLLNEIRVNYIDPGVNELLSSLVGAEQAQNSPYAMRYNHAEEFFIELASPVTVPSLRIHHKVSDPLPTAPYVHAVRDVVRQIAEQLPEAFAGVTYFFDSAEILKPCFYRIYKIESDIYLYLLRIDLGLRPLEGEILEPGNNDRTPAYATKHLYLESELIPLEAVMWEAGRARAFRIRQLISQTWIGETGKGYLVRGIWMDSDLSKFFTKLFLPDGKRCYPFFPLYCKYKTVCAAVPILSAEGRRRTVPLLHFALRSLAPEMETIQNVLRTASFSEGLPDFMRIKAAIPQQWKEGLGRFSIRAYLNEREQKEYSLSYANLEAQRS